MPYEPLDLIQHGLSSLQPYNDQQTALRQKKADENRPLSPYEQSIAEAVGKGYLHPHEGAAMIKVGRLQDQGGINQPGDTASPSPLPSPTSVSSPQPSLSNPSTVPYYLQNPASVGTAGTIDSDSTRQPLMPTAPQSQPSLANPPAQSPPDQQPQDQSQFPVPKTAQEFSQLMEATGKMAPYYAAQTRATTTLTKADMDNEVRARLAEQGFDLTKEGLIIKRDVADTNKDQGQQKIDLTATEGDANRKSREKVATIRKGAGAGGPTGPVTPVDPTKNFDDPHGPGEGITVKEKDGEKLLGDFQKMISTLPSRSSLKANQDRLNAIGRLDSLAREHGMKSATDITPDKLRMMTPQDVALFYDELATIVGQGHPPQGLVEHLTPQTLSSTVANLWQKYTGQPMDANMGQFIKHQLETSQLEQKTIQEQMAKVRSEAMPIGARLIRLNNGSFKDQTLGLLKNTAIDPREYDPAGGWRGAGKHATPDVTGKVKILDPSGAPHAIDPSEVDEAVKHGWKVQ